MPMGQPLALIILVKRTRYRAEVDIEDMFTVQQRINEATWICTKNYGGDPFKVKMITDERGVRGARFDDIIFVDRHVDRSIQAEVEHRWAHLIHQQIAKLPNPTIQRNSTCSNMQELGHAPRQPLFRKP